MDPQNDTDQQERRKGYGKRPVWQWVVIYLVAAVVVYGLIYYFVVRRGSNPPPGTPSLY